MNETTASTGTSVPVPAARGTDRLPGKLVATSAVSAVLGLLSIPLGASFVLVTGLGGDLNPPPPGSWMNNEPFTILALIGLIATGFVGIVAGALAVLLPRAASVLLILNGLVIAAFSLRFVPPFWLVVALWWFLAYLAWRGAGERARNHRLAGPEPGNSPDVVPPPWVHRPPAPLPQPKPERSSTPPDPAPVPDPDPDPGSQLTALRRRMDRRAGGY